MSILKTIRAQFGLSTIATQNFTLDASAADGTMKLARGNAGATTQDILTVDSAGKISFPQGQSLLVLGTVQNTTSGTSIDFTGIPAWAKRITVLLNGVSTSGSSDILVRAGAGSIQATGYDSTVSVGATAGTFTSSTVGFLVSYSGVSPSCVFKGTCTLTLVGSNTWIQTGTLSSTPVQGVVSNSSGLVTLSGTLDRIRLTTVNGTDTFDAGSINILYEG